MKLRSLLLGTALVGVVVPAATAHVYAYHTDDFQDGVNLGSHIEFLGARGHAIDEIGVQHDGEWVVVSAWGVATSPAFSPDALAKIDEFRKNGWIIDAVAFTQDGAGWVVIADQGWWWAGTIPYVRTLQAMVDAELGAGHRIKELSFGPEGWLLISNSGLVHAQVIPGDIFAALEDLGVSERTVNQAVMAPDGGWWVVADDWSASSGVHSPYHDGVRLFQREGWGLDRIALTSGGSFVLYGQSFYTGGNGFVGSMEYDIDDDENLWGLMEDMSIPGMSVAYISNWQVEWARGYGELERNSQRAVYTTDLFDLASCSKTLGAMTLMTLTEGAGTLTLETSARDVADAGPFGNSLSLWLIFSQIGLLGPGDLTSFWADEFTLRRLLSHSASLEPWGSAGNWPADAVPDMFMKLRGYSYGGTYKYSKRVRFDPDIDDDGIPDVPGTEYRYSGGGFLVAQAMAEVSTGILFDDGMRDTLIAELELADMTPHQPLLPEFAVRAAVPHDSLTPEPENERPYYSWTAAGGVWGSAKDLARAVITIMNFGENPEQSHRFLETTTVQEMLTDQAPGSDLYGLGINLSADQVTRSNGEFFNHRGSHAGAKTILAGNPTTGEGIVIAINAGHDGAADFRNIVYDHFKAYHGW